MIQRPVDITIKDTITGEYLKIPVIPEAVDYVDGEALAVEANVIGIGAVNFHNGVNLDSISWTSFFPRRYDPSYCRVKDLKDPEEYRNKISSWKDKGTPVQVIIPSLGINKLMRVKSFPWAGLGGEADLAYSLTLTEHKTIKPTKMATGVASAVPTTVDPPSQYTAKNRPPATAKKADTTNKDVQFAVPDDVIYGGVTPKPDLEVITKVIEPVARIAFGDTLVTAAKVLGKNWPELYAASKKILGPNPANTLVGGVFFT